MSAADSLMRGEEEGVGNKSGAGRVWMALAFVEGRSPMDSLLSSLELLSRESAPGEETSSVKVAIGA